MLHRRENVVILRMGAMSLEMQVSNRQLVDIAVVFLDKRTAGRASAVGIAAFIIAYVTKCPVIYVFSLLSPGSFRQAGRNLHFFSAEPRKFLTSGAKSVFFLC